MKVLITGAGGFVGRVLASQLISKGHEIVGLDVSDARIEGVHDWIRIEPSKPLDRALLPAEVDAVIHLAQSPSYRLGDIGEEDGFKTNIAMHSALLKYASEIGVKQFTSASTGTVYEPFTNGMHEDDKVSPTGYYGASKYAAEVLANAYQNRMNICNIRPFFVYGPGQNDMLMARLVKNISAGGPVNLPKTGEGLLFVPSYVDDVAYCFAKSIEDSWQGTINVASPETVSFETVLKTISSELKKDLVLVREGATPKTPIVPDLTKLSNLVDLKQFTTLAVGIKKTVQYSFS